MRLLRLKDKRLVNRESLPDDTSYAILSHKWVEGKHREITFDDVSILQQARCPSPEKARSFRKVQQFCRAAKRDKYEFVWLDTCCIDAKSLVETSTAINSMYRWYGEAGMCYVYLGQYDASKSSDPTGDVWFTRGWTLQEFVASRGLKFFDKNWRCACTCNVAKVKPRQQNLAVLERIYQKTGIDKDQISSDERLKEISLARRMSWYKGRTTEKPEDNAYCLMGIFAVNMPTFYGEGKVRAFRRLQEEIMRYSDDQSLFAWRLPRSLSPKRTDEHFGLLAPTPDCFEESGGMCTNRVARIIGRLR